MKKVLALILAIVSVFSILAFAGCGNDEQTNNDATNPSNDVVAATGELAEIKEKGTLVIGITLFDPMNFEDADGKMIGFDTELAEAVCKKLGVTPEFKTIDWGTKTVTLSQKKIDCIWNGMTITDAIKNEADVTGAYMKNYQVVVVKDAAKFTTVDSLKGQRIVAESGSAGETVAKANAVLSENYKPAADQATALLQVQTGKAAACVIDYVMAASMLREGKSYSDLTIMADTKLGDDEYYGIACRTDSDLVDAINTAIEELYADGTVKAIADKYLLSDSLIAEFKPSEN